MSQGIISFGGFKAIRAQNPSFDDTPCRIVSSVLAIWGPHGREIQFFDDTIRRVVSSFWVVLRLSEPIFRVSDDTMCRRVSSVLGVSAPHRREIQIFDDTTCRRVSSVLRVSALHRREMRVSDDTMRRVISSPEALIGHLPRVILR